MPVECSQETRCVSVVFGAIVVDVVGERLDDAFLKSLLAERGDHIIKPLTLGEQHIVPVPN